MPDKMDYAAAALEGLKAVPGLGQAVAGPALRLRDAEKQEQFNEEVRAAFAKNAELNGEMLAKIADLTTEVSKQTSDANAVALALEVMAGAVNQCHKDELVSTESILSKWPFRVPENIFRRELLFFFKDNVADFKDGLAVGGFTVPQDSDHDAHTRIGWFVNKARGDKEPVKQTVAYWLGNGYGDSGVFQTICDWL